MALAEIHTLSPLPADSFRQWTTLTSIVITLKKVSDLMKESHWKIEHKDLFSLPRREWMLADLMVLKTRKYSEELNLNLWLIQIKWSKFSKQLFRGPLVLNHRKIIQTFSMILRPLSPVSLWINNVPCPHTKEILMGSYQSQNTSARGSMEPDLSLKQRSKRLGLHIRIS